MPLAVIGVVSRPVFFFTLWYGYFNQYTGLIVSGHQFDYAGLYKSFSGIVEPGKKPAR